MGAGAEIVCTSFEMCDTLVQYVACWNCALLVLWINEVDSMYNSIPITLLRTTLHLFLFRYVRAALWKDKEYY